MLVSSADGSASPSFSDSLSACDLILAEVSDFDSLSFETSVEDSVDVSVSAEVELSASTVASAAVSVLVSV